ncbi:hypothetical protein [Thaumasiovibrio subtropicus]|uniref:hypothetical protein n=1 Tax=Thaumasiovibrio subtropicus TaxID=1891207 RepID=UPI000B3622B6|nr:hypothetical protein [Thaumasiovibrio subtropicus]
MEALLDSLWEPVIAFTALIMLYASLRGKHNRIVAWASLGCLLGSLSLYLGIENIQLDHTLALVCFWLCVAHAGLASTWMAIDLFPAYLALRRFLKKERQE